MLSTLYKLPLLTALIFGLCSVCYGQGVQIEASLDSNMILIGEQTQFNLAVQSKADVRIVFPTILDTLTRSIEVLDVSAIDSTRDADGLLTLMRNYTITSFDSGYHAIPSMPVLAQFVDQKQTDTLFTQPLGLNILLVPVDTSQAIKPIKGPENIPYNLLNAVPWILAGILLIALLFAGYYYYKNRNKNAEPVMPTKPKEAPDVIAIRALDQLNEERLWQSGQVKEHHARLSSIIRAYIEGRFKIPALEHTNREILGSFRNTGLDREVPMDELRQLLYLADIVKFAKGQPQPSDNQRSVEQAYDFVMKTKRKALEAQENAA